MYLRKAIVLTTALLGMAVLRPASAQTVNAISGNGQVRCFLCFDNNAQAFDNLVVQVNDTAGKPVAGATVTWSSTGPGQGAVTQPTTVTDANGQSGNPFFQNPLVLFGQSSAQTTVTASALGASATFTETTSFYNAGNGLAQIQVRIVSGLDVGTPIVGQIGQQNPTPIVVLVYGLTGPSIAGVAVRIKGGNADTGPTIQCASPAGQQVGTVYTDSTGTATCNPIFGGKPGADVFTVDIGNNWRIFPASPASFTVALGSPNLISGRTNVVGGDTSGNNQTGNTGQLLPAPLVVRVADAGGNVLPDVVLQWDIPSGNGTLSRISAKTDGNGEASAYLTLGSNPGAVQVRVSVVGSNISPLLMNFTALASYTGLTIVSGNSQEVAVGTSFAPLVVQVNSASVGVSGVTVNFAVTSGSATLGQASVVTDVTGRAAVNLTAGQVTGAVQVTATVGALVQVFNLSVRSLGPSNVSFVSGAGGVADHLAPCGLATILGSNITAGLGGAVTPDGPGPLPLTLPGVGFPQGKVSVQFGTFFAPISSISNQNGVESINVQVPCELTAGSVPVTIRVGSTSIVATANIQTTAPGIFENSYDGTKRATVIRSNGTLVSISNPALRGETVRVLTSGLGQANGTLSTNNVYSTGLDVLAPVIVGIANRGVPTISARYASNLVGVYEVVFQIPADLPSGIQALAIAIDKGGSLQFGNPTSIPIQ